MNLMLMLILMLNINRPLSCFKTSNYFVPIKVTKTQKFERTQSHKAAPQHLLFAMNRRLNSNHKGLWEIFSGGFKDNKILYFFHNRGQSVC